MSNAPELRRTDKLMSDERVREMIARAYSGRLATVGPDGWPYIVPLLYISKPGEIWVHSARARGHFRANVDHEPRVCFEVDDPGEVFAYGRFECDTSVAYRSVVVFGRIRVVEEEEPRRAFFDALMEKYGDPGWRRPKSFYPRLDQVTVYAMAIERMTGKETPLPMPQGRWPAVDNTKTPDAVTTISPWAPVMVTIRAETSDDQGAIFAVHAAAFPTDAEARLVNALRAGGKATVSLVAEVDATVVGHVLFTPVRLEPGPGSCLGVGLAPLAVWPALQRKGIGARLVDSGLEACHRAGFGFVVVLGEPRYYHRLGFRHALAAGLRNEYGADEEFMVLELQPRALIGASGVVRYGPEFAAVGAG